MPSTPKQTKKRASINPRSVPRPPGKRNKPYQDVRVKKVKRSR